MTPAALAIAATLDAIAGQLDAHCTCELPPSLEETAALRDEARALARQARCLVLTGAVPAVALPDGVVALDERRRA